MGKKFKRYLFNMLMGALRKSANLEVTKVKLSVGDVVYLDNIKNASKAKDTLVLIHGLGADKDTWLQFAKCLTRNYRIIVPDLPGHGQSIQEFSIDYSAESQAQCVVELLESLKINCAHMVGSSMGGAVAIKLAYLRPDIASSLLLIDSLGAVKTASYVSKFMDESGYNPMLEINNKNDYKKMMSLAMVKPPFIPGFMLDVLVADMSERLELNKKISSNTEKDNDLRSILSQIKTPSLVIWGEHDNVLHVDNADIFNQELRNSTKTIIDGAGHVPMVEKPKLIAKHVTNFIDEVAGVE